METSPTFQLGNQRVDRRMVDATLIATMADCATRIKAPENAPPETWTALADRVTRNDAVSTSDLKQIQDLNRLCFKYHRDLHNQIRQGDKTDPAVKAELADVHVYTEGGERVREALAYTSAATAVAATVGASFGPTALLTAYLAYAKLPSDDTKRLVETLQGLRDGTSAMIKHGNAVEMVHEDEVWPQMNRMLDGAIRDGQAGKPTTITAQYYELTNPEILGKLSKAVEAGNKLRVNVDGGRLVAYSGTHIEIDDVPDKFRSLLQLTRVKGDVAVSIYPVAKLLGEPNDLMHRKGLGVGDQFLVTGMNANVGSGENVDAGMVLTGPAARQFELNFARDVNDSAAATNADIFGQRPLANFAAGDVNVGARGLIAMFDCVHGPAPAGSPLPQASTYAELDTIAKSYGEKLSSYIDTPAAKVDELLAKGEQIPLNKEGKKRFMALLQRTLDATRKSANLKRLKDVQVSDGQNAGSRTVTIADKPQEREALFLTAIQNAERFVYVPAFVMTRAVASMLVARRDELKAKGRDLDIRVVADAGVYPDGGTPNEAGVKFLEDNGVPVRWSLLARSGDHDRKVHAKEILTDKGEVCGSTNFSIKGLRNNWEHSAYVTYDPNDPASMKQQQSAMQHFLSLWNNESFELNSLVKGRQVRHDDRDAKDFKTLVDEARFGIQRRLISGIETYEEATGAFVSEKAKGLEPLITQLERAGHDHNSATLLAVEQNMGLERFRAALAALPERKTLDAMKPRQA